MLYHVWFGTRERRCLIFGEIEERVKSLLWQIAQEKGIDLLECETVVDHVHLLLSAEPPHLHTAVHLMKGAIAHQLFQDFPELETDTITDGFWQQRYGAKAIPHEAMQALLDHIRTQKKKREKFGRHQVYPRFKVWLQKRPRE